MRKNANKQFFISVIFRLSKYNTHLMIQSIHFSHEKNIISKSMFPLAIIRDLINYYIKYERHFLCYCHFFKLIREAFKRKKHFWTAEFIIIYYFFILFIKKD